MAKLEKEVWLNQIKEGFYPDSSFLNAVTDHSGLVENDKINLAEAGLDPEVLINNTTYPIRIDQRVDKPISIELDTFETTNTLVRRPEVIEYAYDQLESVIRGHRSILRKRVSEKAAHAYAPKADGEYTPVLVTSGAADGNRLRLTFEDIIALKMRLDETDTPLENRFLVLDPRHVTDLLRQDIKLFKDITNMTEGEPFRFAGFGMFQFSRNPKYKKVGTKWEKVAFTAEDGTNFCSFAFQKDEVMKADGDLHMYERANDPEERGTIVGFDKRFIAFTFRNRGVGAIVSATA